MITYRLLPRFTFRITEFCSVKVYSDGIAHCVDINLVISSSLKLQKPSLVRRPERTFPALERNASVAVEPISHVSTCHWAAQDANAKRPQQSARHAFRDNHNCDQWNCNAIEVCHLYQHRTFASTAAP
jgi:hypothetical protein